MSTETAAQHETVDEGYRVVQRVILPAESNLDALLLYVEAGEAQMPREEPPTRRFSAAPKAPSLHPPTQRVPRENIRGRYSVAVDAGKRVSFATYFNAFPASYWRRWTSAKSVRLTVIASGTATVAVYRSSARGTQQQIDAFAVDGRRRVTVDLPLAQFADGGWYWFDVIGGAQDAVVEEAWWSVVDQARVRGRVSVGVTTYNRAEYCHETIRAVAACPELREKLDELIIVDQGTQRVSDEEGFARTAEDMGSQLRVVEQGNIGGSGGFSRGMYEAANGPSDYVVLLDDDVILEPHSILRLLAFADFCHVPTLVGGHMFDMYNRSVLHRFGEAVQPWKFSFGPTMGLPERHDFQEAGLRSTSWLHRRVDVDYNAWWMCLIPTQVIREIGLSMPVFIKWDDVEYGLRARSHGYPTVTLPGAAVWHLAWIEKDDPINWQAYFLERNRLLAALVYSPYDRGGHLIRESRYKDLKHLISMQYYAEHIRLMAIRDVLAGPDELHAQIGTRVPQIRAMTSDFADSDYKSGPGDFPPTVGGKPKNKGRGPKKPRLLTLLPWAARTAIKHLAEPAKDKAMKNPEAFIANQDAEWWYLSQFDSAVVSNSDGTGMSWHKRDLREFHSMLAESTRLRTQLLTEWPRLRALYREALPTLTSFEEWEKTFANNPPQPR